MVRIPCRGFWCVVRVNKQPGPRTDPKHGPKPGCQTATWDGLLLQVPSTLLVGGDSARLPNLEQLQPMLHSQAVKLADRVPARPSLRST